MQINTFFPVRSTALLLSVCLWGAAGVAWASSGIVIQEGPIQLTPGNPPADQERITTYEVTLENTNCVCNEDVKVIRWLPQNSSDQAKLGNPIGSFEFLGFKTSQNGSPSQQVAFIDMEDESTQTFFIDVKTKPIKKTINNLEVECFFESAEFAFRVCDTGGGCDILDGPCEDPTPYVKTVRLEADALPDSGPGTATLTGTVRDSQNKPVVGATVVVRTKKINCLSNQAQAVKEDTETHAAWPIDNWCGPDCRGDYQITDLPAGEYLVTARALPAGCAKETVTIPSGSGVVVTQNLTLTKSACVDVEEP